MKEDLLKSVCCPLCGGCLKIDAAEMLDQEIWSGELKCTSCGESYRIETGMPLLHLNDESWRPKAVEAVGWVTYHQKLGIYEQGQDSVDLKIPYYPEEPWIKVAKSFTLALDQLKLTGDETVLDLGAGRGWAAKEFTRIGCSVVALDIVTDEHVGLGRGKALMEDVGVYFERIIADGENLPFFSDTFDIVFCAAALHHSSRLQLLLQNIYRVMKPGGRLCAINEPCISILAEEQETLDRDASEEMTEGINETRPNFVDYYTFLSISGLEVVEAFPAEAARLEDGSLLHWARSSGAIRPSLVPGNLRGFAGAWWWYSKLRIKALRKRKLRDSHRVITRARVGRQRTEWAFLVWTGGELFIRAQKK